MKQKEIRVLMVELGKHSRVTTRDSLQKAVSVGTALFNAVNMWMKAHRFFEFEELVGFFPVVIFRITGDGKDKGTKLAVLLK